MSKTTIDVDYETVFVVHQEGTGLKVAVRTRMDALTLAPIINPGSPVSSILPVFNNVADAVAWLEGRRDARKKQ